MLVAQEHRPMLTTGPMMMDDIADVDGMIFGDTPDEARKLSDAVGAAREEIRKTATIPRGLLEAKDAHGNRLEVHLCDALGTERVNARLRRLVCSRP